VDVSGSSKANGRGGKVAAVVVVVVVLLGIGVCGYLWHQRRATQEQKEQEEAARADLDGDGMVAMIDNPLRANQHQAALAAAAAAAAAPPPPAPAAPPAALHNNPAFDADTGVDLPEVKLIPNAMYGGVGGGGQGADTGARLVPAARAQRPTKRRSTATQAAPATPGATAAAAAAAAAGTVVYDTSGGEAQYVARDDMAGAGNVNYEVMDGDGAGAGAPRPGVVSGGAVVMGGRSQLPSSATSNATYDEASLYASNSSNTAIYEMGPESKQQGQQPRGAGGRVIIHAPPAYTVPVKTPKLRADGNNVYDMQVPGMKSKAAAATTTTTQLAAASPPTASTAARPDENNMYDMQVPGKNSKAAAAANTANARTKGAGRGGGGGRSKQSEWKKCTRPAPEGGTCRKRALPGGAGGLFCQSHTCPQCGAGKSSGALGCPAHVVHATVMHTGFGEPEEDAEA
jgi:hypothetical protein